MAADPDLVSVVVPAWNAAATIQDTLCSIRAQTHRALEILVVDDGSGDATPEIVSRHVAQDSRVRLIRQANAGVAAARNRGIEEGSGEFVAPIDADDLWRAEKIARHLGAFRQGGPRMGLVYDWYAAIDMRNRILAMSRRPEAEGDVLRLMCRGNLPGNGSSATMRRQAVLEAGGYDATLRARGAQGCEDWKLHLQIARHWRVGLVREFLTGYRMVPDSMSGDVLQMLRSYDLVMEEVALQHPELAEELAAGRTDQLRWLAARAVQGGQLRNAAALVRVLLRQDSRAGRKALGMLPLSIGLRFARRLLPMLPRRARLRFPIG